MNEAFICDAVRTPFGRYGGALSSVRADDLGAVPLRALMERNAGVDWNASSQRSLTLFNKYAGTKLDAKLASFDALDR